MDMFFPVRKASYGRLKHPNMFALKAQAGVSLTRWPLHPQNRWDAQLLAAAMELLVTLSKVTKCRHRILKVRDDHYARPCGSLPRGDEATRLLL